VRWHVRSVILIVSLVTIGGALLLHPSPAAAHPLSTSAVLLDIGSDKVTGRIQLPIDRLAIARDEPLTGSVVMRQGAMDGVRRYVAAHVSAGDANGRGQWNVSVTGGSVQAIDAVDHLVFGIELTPIGHGLQNFELHYDAIVERLLSHRIFVAARASGADAYTTVGVIDWETRILPIPTRGSIAQQDFWTATRLGISHIASGADHLLFLCMLLLTAPLLARGGHWMRSNQLGRNGIRVIRIVTAFGLGHSITLALATLGYLNGSARVVECLIALSIMVSAVHALRPLTHGEIWIAAGFGLVHGLGFAAALEGLDLSRTSLVVELAGFNVGIELTQLIVVALVMPSMMLLSRTRAYRGVRIALAAGGLILACGWFGERTTMLAHNPFEGVSEALVASPFLVAASLASISVLSWLLPALRRPHDHPDVEPSQRALVSPT
jgi:HupE / UreJ protein